MRRLLGVADLNTIDNWRKKFGFVAEHRERSGLHRGVWLFAPEWLKLYFAAIGVARPLDPELNYRARFEKAKCELAEFELGRARGELVTTAEALQEFENYITVIQRIHQRLCTSCCTLVSGLLDAAQQEAIQTRESFKAIIAHGGDRDRGHRQDHHQHPATGQIKNGRPKRKTAAVQ
jgi:hypothetical protein